MNRIFKFRTPFFKLSDNSFSHFSYWGTIDPSGKDCTDGGHFASPAFSSAHKAGWHQQYSGLKDKNGKEIYEGDIIQNVSDDGRRLSKFEISWQQSCCGFVKEREDGNTFTLEISRFFEVIGNIHQNPELL